MRANFVLQGGVLTVQNTAALRKDHDLVRFAYPRAAEHPVLVYLASLAPGSRRAMRTALQNIALVATGDALSAEHLPWHHLSYAHTQAIRAALLEKLAPASVNKHLSALRGVLRESWRLGLMSAEAFRSAADLKNVRGEGVSTGRALEAHELRALFDVCLSENTRRGLRDAAIFALLYGAGLRRAEIALLRFADYNREATRLRVRGKGARERLVPLGRTVRQVLHMWLDARSNDEGALFYRIRKNGEVVQEGVGAQSIMEICQRRASEAKVRAFSPHDLRRTYISHLLDAGADIVTVKRLAGHQSVETTARYDRRGEREKDRAAELIVVPLEPR